MDALYQPFPIPSAARAHIWRYAPENRRPRHFHSEPELNLIATGTGKFGMGETEIPVGPGDLLWWPPGQDHVLLDASPDFDLFVVGVTPELSARVLGETRTVAYGGPVCTHLAPAVLAKVVALCAAPLGQDASAIEQHIGEFWRSAHRLRTSAPDMHTLTRRTLISLLERPHLRRTDVAALVHGYPTEISRHFRKDMGLTLTTYRTRLRLLRFIQSADDGADSLLAAAFEAGFGSYSQCHRAFQQALGCTPRIFFETNVRRKMRDKFSPWTRRAT